MSIDYQKLLFDKFNKSKRGIIIMIRKDIFMYKSYQETVQLFWLNLTWFYIYVMYEYYVVNFMLWEGFNNTIQFNIATNINHGFDTYLKILFARKVRPYLYGNSSLQFSIYTNNLIKIYINFFSIYKWISKNDIYPRNPDQPAVRFLYWWAGYHLLWTEYIEIYRNIHEHNNIDAAQPYIKHITSFAKSIAENIIEQDWFKLSTLTPNWDDMLFYDPREDLYVMY